MAQPVFIVIMAGLLGLIVGSFIAAVSVRLPRGEGVVGGRSHCMSCGTALKAWHLVPVFSWLILRARCAACGAGISPRYPLIELAGMGICIWAALHADSNLVLIAVTAVLGWQLLLIALIDREHFWLPDILTLPLILAGLGAAAVVGGSDLLLTHLIGAVVGFATLWLLAFVYKWVRGRQGLGGGDPILFAGAGAWVGWLGLPSVLLWACAAGFAVVFARLVTRRAVSGTDRLPFGVFLAVGIWLTWLYGPLGL